MPLFNSKNPPPFWEIIGLPLSGAMAIDAFHTKQNELVLFFIPFLLAVIRLFIAQFQLPAIHPARSELNTGRAVRMCVALNQISVFFLILFECGVVIATNPTVPLSVGAIVMIPFAFYVILRLASRRYWMLAGAISSEI